jgi:hypothetical protein
MKNDLRAQSRAKERIKGKKKFKKSGNTSRYKRKRKIGKRKR